MEAMGWLGGHLLDSPVSKYWSIRGAYCHRTWDGHAFMALKYTQLSWNAGKSFLSQGKGSKKPCQSSTSGVTQLCLPWDNNARFPSLHLSAGSLLPCDSPCGTTAQ